MLWVKALHIIFVITWFAALFYLPRLFVYHALSEDKPSIERFKIMERKLYRGIMMPSAILATIFGLWLFWQGIAYYKNAGWMHAKLVMVALLWVYHFSCGYYVKVFKQDTNQHSDIFYRWFNEIPVIFLLGIVILAVVKPF